MTTTYDEVLISLGIEPSGGEPQPRKAVAECGTPSGYNRHVRRREETCALCRAANAAYKRARWFAPKDPAALPPIEHGSHRGARRHWYRGERPCKACARAYSAWSSPRRRARRTRKAVNA